MTPPAIPLSPGLSYIDLNFLRQPKAIATAVVNAPGFVALIDPGPSTSIESLERGLQAQGLKLDDVTVILLTHIHIDHAGAQAQAEADRQPRDHRAAQRGHQAGE